MFLTIFNSTSALARHLQKPFACWCFVLCVKNYATQEGKMKKTVLLFVSVLLMTPFAHASDGVAFKCTFRGDIKGVSTCSAVGKICETKATNDAVCENKLAVTCDSTVIYQDGLTIDVGEKLIRIKGNISTQYPFPPVIVATKTDELPDLVSAWLYPAFDKSDITRGYCAFARKR